MLTPQELAMLPAAILLLWEEAEQSILADMARRISTYDFWIPAADYQNQKLLEASREQSEILKILSVTTQRSTQELRKMMEEAGSRSLKTDIETYEEAGLNPPKPAESERLKAILTAGYAATAQTMKNLTRTTANTATKQFEDALDLAWLQVTSGGFDYNAAIRGAIKNLADAGIGAITYPSGHVDSIEVAVRRAVLTGVNQTSQQLSMALADELGCDLVEVSAHPGARPSHADWQGHIFSLSGKNKKYPEFRSATGYGTGAGLGGWNCRHSFDLYIEGSTPVWSEEKLRELNEPCIEYNGKMITQYEAEQKQRYHERQIRKYKREYLAMEAGGQDTGAAAAKLKKWREKEKDFLSQTGLKQSRDRELVAGFGKKQAAKATQAAKAAKEAAEKEVLQNIEKQDILRKKIDSGELSTKLSMNQYYKHVEGTKQFEQNQASRKKQNKSTQSILTISAEEAQELIDKYQCTGVITRVPTQKSGAIEYCATDHEVGLYVTMEEERLPTNRFAIHYSGKNAHIVPVKER